MGEVEDETALVKFTWENFRLNIIEEDTSTTANPENIESIEEWELQYAQKMQEKDYRKAISILIRKIESNWEIDNNIIRFSTNILEALKKLPPNTQLQSNYNNLTNLIAQKLLKRNPLEFIHIIESLSEKYVDKLILGDI